MQGLLKKVKCNQYIFSKKLEKLKTDNCMGLIRLTSQEKTTFGLQYKKRGCTSISDSHLYHNNCTESEKNHLN